MKKFLLFVVFAAVLGYSNKATAQCAGAGITVTNLQSNATTWSYNWIFNNGNASISVVFKCGGQVVYTEPCYENLKNQPPGVVSGNLPAAILSCSGVKEIEVRVYASSNCNGTYCVVLASGPLPVSFASFTAARNRANVNISWSTASEQNNSGFVVERNSNGLWESVGNVASKAVNGNSDALLTYSFSDLNNTKGITQYRIKQIDFDAKSKYSEIRSVRGDGQKGKTIIYPNPSTDGKVNVVFEETNVVRDISVTDMAGRTVKQMKGLTNNNITIENLTPGMYTLRVLVPSTGDQTVEKIIVNKR